MTPIHIPHGLHSHINSMVDYGSRFEGLMTQREMEFLILLAAVPTANGDILEIGSFKGRSTILLAKSAAVFSTSKVIAVDPLEGDALWQSSQAGVSSVANEFYSNIQSAGVRDLVEFHQTYSSQLARSWVTGRKIRLLWIDGDHTAKGVRADFELFFPHLAEGAIVAFHDVLHSFNGPTRVFADQVLSREDVCAAGVVGSIGWAQIQGRAGISAEEKGRIATLKRRVSRVADTLVEELGPSGWRSILFKLRRAMVPHGALEPATWANSVDGTFAPKLIS
jgi:predicted O-methyltransferase YrrM